MFILKKLISHFLLPVPIIAILLCIGLFCLYFTPSRKKGKACVLLATLLLLASAYKPVPDYLLHHLETQYRPLQLTSVENRSSVETAHHFKYVVVLGGGFADDPGLPATSQLGQDTLTRLVEGIRLQRKISGSRLVVSGGKISGKVAMAEIMKKVALDLGVKASDIIVEDHSPDTVSEAYYLKPLLGTSAFVLVTSAAHMPRAMLLFRQMGLQPIPAPANFLIRNARGTSVGLYFPGSTNLRNTGLAIHEYLGTLWAKIALRGPYRKSLHQE